MKGYIPTSDPEYDHMMEQIGEGAPFQEMDPTLIVELQDTARVCQSGINALEDLYELIGVPPSDPEYDYLFFMALNYPDECVVCLRMKPEYNQEDFGT